MNGPRMVGSEDWLCTGQRAQQQFAELQERDFSSRDQQELWQMTAALEQKHQEAQQVSPHSV